MASPTPTPGTAPFAALASPSSKPARLDGRWTTSPPRSDEAAVSSYVLNRFYEARQLRRREEAGWFLDIKMLGGDQWLKFDADKFALYAKPKKPWRIQQTINQLRGNMEVLVDLVTSRTGKPVSTPVSGELEARIKSRAAVKLFQALWQSLDMDEKADELSHWVLVCGIAALKPGWDPGGGDLVELPDYGALPEGVLPGPGVEVPMQQIRIGDISTEVVSSFNFFYDPSAPAPRNAAWMGDVGYAHVELVRDLWPDKRDEIVPDAGEEMFLNFQRRLLQKQSARSLSSDINESVTVRTIFLRPDGKYPTGRKIVVAGSVVVEDVESPHDGEFPYAVFQCYRQPGSITGQGAARLGRNPQKAYNAHRSLAMEHMLKGGNTQWLVTKGAGVKRDDLTDEPGHVIMYNPVGVEPVKALHPAPMPPGFEQLLNLDLQDVREGMGVVDVLRGVNPPGVRAGRTFAYAVEQVMGRHRPLIKRFARGWTQLGRHWLRLAKKFYQEDRWISVLGESGRAETFLLRPDDLRSASSLMISADSIEPTSKAARQDLVIQLWGAGLIVTPAGLPDPARALKLMGFSGSPESDIYDPDEEEREWAQEESERMAQGEQLPAEPHDNHEVHGEEHVRFMRTGKYRDLQDEVKAIIRAHLDGHIAILQGQAPAPTMQPGQGAADAEPAAEDMRGGGAPGEPRTDLRGGPK